MREIILASSSPRRQELLEQMGIPFRVFVPQVDEHLSGSPEMVVQTLAQRKANAAGKVFPSELILAADTLVYTQGKILGKPENPKDAAGMLRCLSGAWHEVLTGVCLLCGNEQRLGCSVTKVRFSVLTEADISYYCNTGEPMGKAGAYAIQGTGGQFVEEIQGNYANVVGLPTALVRSMLKQFNYLH